MNGGLVETSVGYELLAWELSELLASQLESEAIDDLTDVTEGGGPGGPQQVVVWRLAPVSADLESLAPPCQRPPFPSGPVLL